MPESPPTRSGAGVPPTQQPGRQLRLRARLAAPVLRNAVYLILAEAVAAVLGLVFWIVAARLFPNDATLGAAAVLITSATLLAILSTLGFNVSLVRFLPEGTVPAARLINSSVTLGSILAIALAAVFGLLAGGWLPAIGFLAGDPVLLVLFSFFTAIWTISLLFDAALIGLGHARYVLLRAIVFNVLKVPLPIALGALIGPFALFSSWGIGLLVANAMAATYLFAKVVPGYHLRPDLDRHTVGSMIRYSVANHTTNVLGVVPGLIFPLLVAKALRPEDAAYFYIAWVLASFLFIIPGSIFTSVFAEGSRWRPGLRGNTLEGLYISIAVLVPGVVAVLIAGPWVLAALKPSFVAGLGLLNVLAASSFFVAINAMYSAVFRVEKRMRPVVGLYAGTTLIALALGWPLMVATQSIVGAGLAFGVAQGAGAGYSLWSMFREGKLVRAP